MRAVNASPAKVYIMLFAIVVVGYVAFIIVRSLKNTTTDVEHFIEEHPNYKFRMEVMKVFDLYLNRNPSTEELEKYSVIKNEQDILLAILKDFQINVNDVDPEKVNKYSNIKVEEEFQENIDILEDAKIAHELENPITETFSTDIKISRETFDSIKTQLKSLYDLFASLDRNES